MANLKEQEIFEEGIYQWETSDPLMGGENGIDNLPLRQLANRTRWLKKSVEEAARSLGESKLDKAGGTLTGALLAAVGTTAGKGYAFDRDSDTGMFSPRDGVLQIMANNVVVAEFDAAEALNGTSLKNKRGDRLVLQADGNGVLYDAAGKVVWSAFATVSKNELSDGLAKKQDLLGYTPLNKAGDTLTGALKVNGGSGTHAGIKGDVDHDTGFEWRQDGLLSGVVNGQERIRLASVSGDGTTKISSADGHYVLLQDDGKMVYYDSKHNPLFDSSRVPQIDILTGTIADGGTIPLPAGYTQEQCFWMVSTSRDNPDDIPWDIDESGRHVHYGYECTLNGRVVSCKVWFNKKRTTMGNAHPEITVGGVANYIIIGKKYGAI